MTQNKIDIENYELIIPFSLISYPPIVVDIELCEFDINNLNLKLTKNNNKYYLNVSNFDDKSEICDFIENFEFFIKYYTLGWEYCAIEYDENEIYPKGISMELKEVQIKETSDRFEKELEKTLTGKYELTEDLKLALDIYSKHAQYNKKSQYLDLITILEILKPTYPVSDKSLKAIGEIKKDMKSIRKNFKNGSEEFKEFDRYFHDLKFWEDKSINSSLQKFANEHQEDFKEFKDIGNKLKRAYAIRSNITHNGFIDDDFEKYYNFLRKFVGKLLKIMIDESRRD